MKYRALSYKSWRLEVALFIRNNWKINDRKSFQTLTIVTKELHLVCWGCREVLICFCIKVCRMSNNLCSQVKESNSTLFQLLSENSFLLDENKFCSNIYFKIKTGAVSAFASKIIFDNNGFKVRRMHKKNTEPKNSSIENN